MTVVPPGGTVIPTRIAVPIARPLARVVLLASLLLVWSLLAACAPSVTQVRPVRYAGDRDAVFEVVIATMRQAGFEVVVDDRVYGLVRGRLTRTGTVTVRYDVNVTIASSRTAALGSTTVVSFESRTNHPSGVIPEQAALIEAVLAALDARFMRS
jgi:hypothetical protein